jgi:hypothetical protein
MLSGNICIDPAGCDTVSMTDAQMQAAAATMCANAGQVWDVPSQSCVSKPLVAGVSNMVIYAFGGFLALIVLMSIGGRR